MNKKILKLINKSTNIDPFFAKDGDSGFDLKAWITKNDDNAYLNDKGEYEIVLDSLERRLIHTGNYFELPENTEIQVRTRSGMALKQGLLVANSPGTVDSKYQGEVGVILINLSKVPVTITNGDRIAQGVLCPVFNKELVEIQKIEKFDSVTERGTGGFGSSGVK